MPFDYRNWGVIQPGGTQEFLQDGSVIGAPGIYTYQSQDESLLDLSSVDYFSPVGNTLFINDLLYLSASDGTGLFYVLAVDFETGNLIIGREVPASGDVNGPSSSTVDAVALWNNTTGTLLKNSVVLINGGGNISGANNYTGTGSLQSVTLNITGNSDLLGNLGVGGTSTLNSVNMGLGATLSLFDSTNSFKISFKASESMSQITNYTLPDSYPIRSGQQLTSSTGGVMSWQDAAEFTWVTIDSGIATVNVVPGTGYLLSTSVLTTFNLPSDAVEGDTFEIRIVAGTGSSFKIQPPTGHFVQLGSGLSTAGPTGNVRSTGVDTFTATFGPDGMFLWVGGASIGIFNFT